MKKLTADQKRAAITAGALLLTGLTQSGKPFCVSEAGLSRVAARIQTAEKSDVLASLFWDDDDDDEEEDAATYRVTADGTAIIPIYGVMLDTAPTWWLSWYGATSTPQITGWVAEATTDANVKRILLDLDTPGGQASGVSALADAVFAASAGGKPVWAMCREACSAGYFVASQADKVIARTEGDIGCIGTLIVLGDWSDYYTKMGVEKTRITSTGAEAYKGAGSIGTIITAAQKTDFGRQCDEVQVLFNAAIARGRGLTDEKAQAWADGRYFLGYVALSMGMVDETGDPETILAKFGDADNGAKDPPPAGEDPANYESSRRKKGNLATRPSTPGAIGAQGKLIMSLRDRLTAAFAGGNETTEEKLTAATETITTLTAENEDLKAENKRYRDAESERNNAALTASRDRAFRAAVTAKGQNHADLPAIKAQIESISDPATLDTLATAFVPAGTAITNPTGQTNTSNPAVNADETTLESTLAAAKAAGDAANKPRQKGH